MDATTPAAANLAQLLNERYSCRGFRPDPVPRAMIDTILTMAQRTASWCNSIAQAALAAHPEFWREQLSLEPNRKLVCGISFGYEDPVHPANGFRTSRAPISKATRWIE